MQQQKSNWRSIIWRELQKCKDGEYTRHLFELVTDEPVGRRAMATILFFAVLYGAMVGLLIALIATNWDVRYEPENWSLTWTALLGVVGTGSVIGGGGLLRRLLSVRRLSPQGPRRVLTETNPNTWGFILNFVLTAKLLGGFVGLVVALFVALSVGLSVDLDDVGMFVGMFVALFVPLSVALFSSPSSLKKSRFYYFMCAFLILYLIHILLYISALGVFFLPFVDNYFDLNLWSLEQSRILSTLVALLLIPGAGLLLARVTWLFDLLFLEEVARPGDWEGDDLPITLALSIWLVVEKVIELVNRLVVGLVIELVIGHFVGLASWVIAESLLMVLMVVLLRFGKKNLSKRLWWEDRPFCLEVETALRQACACRTCQVWAEPLRRLEERKKSPSSLDSLLTSLGNDNWVESFVARHALVAQGSEAIEPLRVIAREPPWVENKINSRRTTAVWLLKSIADDTTVRLKKQAHRLLCPHCLVYCAAHSVRLSWRTSFTYYGCRACRQSQDFLSWPGQVVAVLDAGMAEEQVQQDGVLRVNWWLRQELFDFDKVEIVQATDEQVERFAVQVGNDTDEVRQPRYKKVRGVVAAGCQLSENTWRILKDRFGQVDLMKGEEMQ